MNNARRAEQSSYSLDLSGDNYTAAERVNNDLVSLHCTAQHCKQPPGSNAIIQHITYCKVRGPRHCIG